MDNSMCLIRSPILSNWAHNLAYLLPNKRNCVLRYLKVCTKWCIFWIFVMLVFLINDQKTNLESLLSCLTIYCRYCRWCWGIQRLCVWRRIWIWPLAISLDLYLLLCRFHLPSFISSCCLGAPLHIKKNYSLLSLSYSSTDAPCAKWHWEEVWR